MTTTVERLRSCRWWTQDMAIEAASELEKFQRVLRMAVREAYSESLHAMDLEWVKQAVRLLDESTGRKEDFFAEALSAKAERPMYGVCTEGTHFVDLKGKRVSFLAGETFREDRKAIPTSGWRHVQWSWAKPFVVKQYRDHPDRVTVWNDEIGDRGSFWSADVKGRALAEEHAIELNAAYELGRRSRVDETERLPGCLKP